MTTDEIDFAEIIEVEIEGRAVPREKKLHIVQRLAWCPVYNEDYCREGCKRHHPREGVPVVAFEMNAEATEHAQQLTAEVRKEFNPFQFKYGDLATCIDERSLLASIRARRLPRPSEFRAHLGYDQLHWPQWYDKLADTLTDAQRNAIWDRVNLGPDEFYRVVEVKVV